MIRRLLRSFFGRTLHIVFVAPPNWHRAVEDTIEVLARRYNLDMVQRDLQGPNKRFPVFKDDFFRELTKRLG